jgi:polyribonucleotide nucleotidyltransferase
MQATSKTVQIGGRDLTLETGKMAKQAHGSTVLRYGDTVLLVTAVSAPDAKPGLDIVPLTVDYPEKLFAAGRIPGNYFRREGRPRSSSSSGSRT